MKTLLIAKAIVEVGAGLALALFPSLAVSLLLGARLDSLAETVIARMAGAALLAMGTACWLAANDSKSRAATGLIAGLLLYDVTVVVILLQARFAVGLAGIALWPAVVLHSGLGVWSLLCLRRRSREAAS